MFDAALLREQGERQSYVEAVCAPDEELARAVHSLLLANDHATGFAGAPILEHAARLRVRLEDCCESAPWPPPTSTIRRNFEKSYASTIPAT